MRAERLIPNTAWFFSLLLGQASILLGLMVALAWSFAFTLLVPHRAVAWGVAGAHGSLPIAPPLIGLGLAGTGLLLARCCDEPIARFSVAGLIINTVPLILALVLLFTP